MARSDNLTGALLMMGSMAAFTFNDAMIKGLSGSLPVFQVMFLRGILTTLMVALVAWWMGALARRLPRADWGPVLWRMVGEIGSAYFFVTALFHMPIANISEAMGHTIEVHLQSYARFKPNATAELVEAINA